MSDATIISIVGSLITLGGTIFAGVMAYHMAKLNRVAADTHTLVNSAMGLQLDMHEDATRRLAEKGEPADMAAYVEAKRKNDEHKAQQAIVDTGKKTQKL